MARLVVVYKTPTDGAAFDRYYFETHVPIAKKIPGLRKYEVSNGPIGTPAGASNVHLIATLHFDDLAAIKHAFASVPLPAWRAGPLPRTCRISLPVA